jgi:hypothetical protein
MLPLRQWSGHSLGPPLRLGLRRPLGPGLRLEPLQGLAPRRAAVRLPLLGPAAMSHSLCSRSVTASQNDSPSSRNVAAADFRRCSTSSCSPRGPAPISIRPVEVSSFLSHLPVMRSEVAFAGARRVRSAFRSRPSGPRVMHSRRRALWVPVDAPHEVFALCAPRAARPVDCRSAQSKNALNPARVAVSSRARPDSSLPKCPARKPQPRRTLPFSHALPRARPRSARSGSQDPLAHRA